MGGFPRNLYLGYLLIFMDNFHFYFMFSFGIHPLFFLVPARVSDVGRVVYVPQSSRLELGCQVVGDPIPSKKWFLNGRDESWLNRHTATAPSESLTGYNTNNHIMAIDDVTPGKDNGNFTCYVENSLGSDSVTYNVLVQGHCLFIFILPNLKFCMVLSVSQRFFVFFPLQFLPSRPVFTFFRPPRHLLLPDGELPTTDIPPSTKLC